MRKILITLAILILLVGGLSAFWVFNGRQIALFIDQFRTIQTASTQIKLIVYEGSGTGGILHVNDLALSLNDAKGPSPNIGSTRDDQLALAVGGKVFAFGPPRSEAENLAAVPPADDETSITIQHSILSWPTPFDFNFMTGQAPSWRRHVYYRLHWKKPSGANLEMLWRYEQYFYPANGWRSGFMTRQDSTGLIRVDIRP